MQAPLFPVRQLLCTIGSHTLLKVFSVEGIVASREKSSPVCELILS